MRKTNTEKRGKSSITCVYEPVTREPAVMSLECDQSDPSQQEGGGAKVRQLVRLSMAFPSGTIAS